MHRSSLIATVCAIGFGVLSCTYPVCAVSEEPISAKKYAPGHALNEQECLKGGGRWMGSVSGRGRLTGCVMPTSDGGKKCKDSSDCEGVCLQRYDQATGRSDSRCHEWDAYKGCGIVVTDQGKRKIICID